jgi:hypothetical protein
MLSSINVFVDDLIGLAQDNADRLARVRRILLHAIDDVLRPNDHLRQEAPPRQHSLGYVQEGLGLDH